MVILNSFLSLLLIRQQSVLALWMKEIQNPVISHHLHQYHSKTNVPVFNV